MARGEARGGLQVGTDAPDFQIALKVAQDQAAVFIGGDVNRIVWLLRQRPREGYGLEKLSLTVVDLDLPADAAQNGDLAGCGDGHTPDRNRSVR